MSLVVLTPARTDLFGMTLDSVLVTEDNGQTSHWYKAKEVCDRLGFTNAVRAVNENVLPSMKRNIRVRVADGGNRPTSYLSEGGVNSLILASKTDNTLAKRTEIVEKVMPSLDRHDGYLRPNISDANISILLSKLTAGKIVKFSRDQCEEMLEKLEGTPGSDVHRDLLEIQLSTIKSRDYEKRRAQLKKSHAAAVGTANLPPEDVWYDTVGGVGGQYHHDRKGKATLLHKGPADSGLHPQCKCDQTLKP